MDYTAQDATFDLNNTLRLTLRRMWDRNKPYGLVAMLNPSRGDGAKDDPTLMRLTTLMNNNGFGGYTVVNWSPFISPTPEEMLRFMYSGSKLTRYAMDKNLATIKIVMKAAKTAVVAWGNHFPGGQSVDTALSDYNTRFVAAITDDYRRDLMCFGRTLSGAPKHPLARGPHRIADTTKLMPWIGVH